MTPPLLLTYFDRTARWMKRGGRENDIVLSSRVRLARNLKYFEFPHRASPRDLLVIRHRTLQALHATAEAGSALSDGRHLLFENFNSWERQSLIDRYVTSREHIEEEMGRAVIASPDASLAVLINEEDHLRIQSLLPGLQLDAAHTAVDRLDDALETWLDERSGLAYSETFGYLTTCPTNAGTGLRASVMMHLPALEITGKMERTRKWAEENQLALRGSFGEGSKIWGHLHQLSNQLTLGVDETETLLMTENAARELCDMERRARVALNSDKWQEEARDRIGRAFGTLRYARRVGCREATEALSLLRMAHEMNWAKGLTRQRFNELLVWIRPAYMQVLHGRTIHSQERDILRATMLRPHIARIKLDAAMTSAETPRGASSARDYLPHTNVTAPGETPAI
jgi:protein arginine kinase